jgi:hypothetical protein
MGRFVGPGLKACAGVAVTFGACAVARFTMTNVDGWGERVVEGFTVGHSVALSSGDGRLGCILTALALVATHSWELLLTWVS